MAFPHRCLRTIRYAFATCLHIVRENDRSTSGFFFPIFEIPYSNLEVYSYPNKTKFPEDVVDIACLRYVSIVYAYKTSSVGESHSSDFLFVRVSCEKVFVRRQATIR